MKRRREGCALASQRDIGTTEVRYRGNSGRLGEDMRISDLQCVGRLGIGAMADRMAVTGRFARRRRR